MSKDNPSKELISEAKQILAKQKVIKKAWGELFDSFTEEDKKFIISENGYLVHDDFMFIYNDYLLWNDIELIKNPFTNHLYRPKSLQGIENNNGWIKIESEDDLPKETIECRTCFYDGKNYIKGNTGERNAKQLWNAYESIQITHYQPIEKQKPPIY